MADRARRARRAAARRPRTTSLFYNLGLIFQRNGLLDDASAAFALDAINPRHVASSSRPSASDRLADLDTERRRLATLGARWRPIRVCAASYRICRVSSPAADLLAARGEPLAAGEAIGCARWKSTAAGDVVRRM